MHIKFEDKGEKIGFHILKSAPPQVSCKFACLAVLRCLLYLATLEEHYPWNFMHFKPFTHNSAGGDTHSHIHLLITKIRVNHIPEVPGRLDPPAEGKKKNLSPNVRVKHTIKHMYKYSVCNNHRLASKPLRHNSEHTDKEK